MKKSFTNSLTAKTGAAPGAWSSQGHGCLKILGLALILIAAASTGASAQKTRDRLFPNFQQDISGFQQKEAAADPRKTATSTRSLIFTDYQRSANTGNSRRSLQRPVTPGGQQLPSDISAAEAARKIAPPAKNVKPQLPQQ